MSLGRWADDPSNDSSLGAVAECGDAAIGEYSSPVRGELKADKGCDAGDAGLDGYEGPAGRRAGPTGGVDPRICCPPRESVTAALSRLYAARSG